MRDASKHEEVAAKLQELKVTVEPRHQALTSLKSFSKYSSRVLYSSKLRVLYERLLQAKYRVTAKDKELKLSYHNGCISV